MGLNSYRWPLSPQQRFWSNVNKSHPDSCWEWQGVINSNGYGTLKVGQRAWLATRLLWTWLHGEIPQGMCVLHKCDNPPCVNPDHLFLGTRKDNYDDMVAKGRLNRARGEHQGSAKMTADKVRELRRLYEKEGKTQIEISGIMGIHQTTVSRIIERRTWKHVK